jgi:hypothetical protein
MNEKEFELYERSVDKVELVYVQADIARQLTRIADQGGPHIEIKEVGKDLARHQPCGCILCFCYGDRCLGCGAISCGKDDCVLKTSKGIVYADEPTPDALVEKIKALRKANEFCRAYIAATHKNHLDYTFLSPLEGSNIKDGMEMAYSLEADLNKALADHEKAVR